MKSQSQADLVKQKGFYSKAFQEGIKTLQEELRFAFQWQRPSILLAVHDSTLGQSEAQNTLKKEIEKTGIKVEHLKIDGQHPDVISGMNEVINRGHIVFFVTGIEKNNGFNAYNALNFSRELLVENPIRVVFWFTRAEANALPRLAPDFWAFRHRVIEFAPKRGKRSNAVPAGLFLWKERIPWMELNFLTDDLTHHQKTLSHLPDTEDSITLRLEILLRLIHICWLMNDTQAFSTYLKNATQLSSRHSYPEFDIWLLTAKAITEYEGGHVKSAFDLFTQALNFAPNNSVVMMNHSAINHALGRNKAALLIGKRALKNDPANPIVPYVLGYLYLSMGKTVNAIEEFMHAQGKDPANIDAHYLLALCYLNSGQPAQSTEEIARAKQVSPRQNLFQQFYENIATGKVNEVRSQIHQSLQQGKISIMQVLRDPILNVAMDPREFSTLKP